MRVSLVVAALLCITTLSAVAQTDGPPSRSLPVGQALSSGQSVASPNGRYLFMMQQDGNLVLSDMSGAQPRPIWSSATDRYPGATCVFQSDGNLVIYSDKGQSIWSTKTSGHSDATELVLQDDGQICLNGQSGPIWRSGDPNLAATQKKPSLLKQIAIELDKQNREKQERERREAEEAARKAEIWRAERRQREQADRERIQREQAERERLQREQRERDRLQREQAERDRLQRERDRQVAEDRRRRELPTIDNSSRASALSGKTGHFFVDNGSGKNLTLKLYQASNPDQVWATWTVQRNASKLQLRFNNQPIVVSGAYLLQVEDGKRYYLDQISGAYTYESTYSNIATGRSSRSGELGWRVRIYDKGRPGSGGYNVSLKWVPQVLALRCMIPL